MTFSWLSQIPFLLCLGVTVLACVCHSLTKERPWVKRFTSPPKRGSGAFSRVGTHSRDYGTCSCTFLERLVSSPLFPSLFPPSSLPLPSLFPPPSSPLPLYSPFPSTTQSPSMKFYNFRRKKRPWSIHQLSLPPTPTRSTIIGLTPSTEEENKHTENTTPQHPSGSSGYASSSGSSQPDSSTEDGLGVNTRRPRSNSLARRQNTRGRPRSYSYSVNDSQQSVRSFTEQESSSETSMMKDVSSEALSNPIPEVQEEKDDTKDSSRLEREGEISVRQRGGGRGGGGGGTGKDASQASSKPAGLECRTRPRLLKFGNDKSPTGGATLKTAPALVYTGKGQLPSAGPSKLNSTKSLASNTSSPLAESPSKMEEEEEAGEEKVIQRELVNENSRKSVPERNLLVPYKTQDPKSGITNVRESVLVESSPRLRRGKTGLQSAARDPQKRRSLIETTSLRSFTSQRQHDVLATLQRKDISQDDINLSTSTTEPVSLPVKEEALEPPKQSLPSRGTGSPVLTEPVPTQTSRNQSDRSPRSVAAVTRNYSDSILVPSRSSSSTDQQGSAVEQQTTSANLPRKIKHTVAYKESSARAKKGKNESAPISYCASIRTFIYYVSCICQNNQRTALITIISRKYAHWR